jgi:hypothetical protein
MTVVSTVYARRIIDEHHDAVLSSNGSAQVGYPGCLIAGVIKHLEDIVHDLSQGKVTFILRRRLATVESSHMH